MRQPTTSRPGAVERQFVLGPERVRATILTTGAETAGRHDLTDSVLPAGSITPLHLHTDRPAGARERGGRPGRPGGLPGARRLHLGRPVTSGPLEDVGDAAGAVVFPRALLPLRPGEVAGLSAVRFPGDQGTGALVSSLGRELVRRLDDWGAGDGARLGTAVLDLFTVALAARLDRADQVRPDTRQRALRQRVHAFIEAQLGDPGLSPATIAAAHYISVRSLYKLFEVAQAGVAGWIRQRRLERCRRDLLDPGLATRPVSAIAARWGLTNAAHFSRASRAAYGRSPVEYRTVANGSSRP